MSKENDVKLIKEMLDKINELGYDFPNSTWINKLTKKDKNIVPIFCKYNDLMEPGSFGKQRIVAYMGIKGMTEFSNILIKEFVNDLNETIRWYIAASLYRIEDSKHKNNYIDFLKNDKYGMSRQMIILLVGKLRIKEALPELMRLLNDDDCSGHCVEALGNYDDLSLISYIEPFLKHETEWIRKAASKSIRDIRKRCSD